MKMLLLVLIVGVSVAYDNGTPTAVPPPPTVSGVYTGRSLRTLQVHRTSDGFRKSFLCAGRLTLTQGQTVAGARPAGRLRRGRGAL